MKHQLTGLLGLALTACLSSPVFAQDDAAIMDLAKKNNCLACHSIDSKLVGPAWREIGKRYADDPAAAEQLALHVKKGSRGVWGPVPMPPNATLKDEDIQALVGFILSLK